MNENHSKLCPSPEWADWIRGELHAFHAGDAYNPVEPAAFLTRLQTLGFGKITIGVDHVLTFVAHKPSGDTLR